MSGIKKHVPIIDLKRLRTQLGFTQEEVARTLGVSWITVSRWERGVSRPSPLGLQQLQRLANKAQK
jgi:DNA-binding transcriptional regulator YiaG